jgi:hypothetical protein
VVTLHYAQAARLECQQRSWLDHAGVHRNRSNKIQDRRTFCSP